MFFFGIFNYTRNAYALAYSKIKSKVFRIQKKTKKFPNLFFERKNFNFHGKKENFDYYSLSWFSISLLQLFVSSWIINFCETTKKFGKFWNFLFLFCTMLIITQTDADRFSQCNKTCHPPTFSRCFNTICSSICDAYYSFWLKI